MEVSAAVALVVAIALMALGMAVNGWLQRAEARREEVRRLAWQAAEEVEIAEREEAYCYAQYGGAFVRAPDVPEAPPAPLWTAPPEVAPSPKEAEDEVAVAASPPPGKACAMCARPTTLRCKRCKSVKYCTFKCQIDHWRKVHRDECHPPVLGATQDGTPEYVVAGVELKEMPSDKPSNTAEAAAEYSEFTGKAESVDCSRLSTSSKSCKVYDNAVRENLCLTAHGHSAYCLSRNPSKREDNSPGSKMEWCFMCELEKVMTEGKRGNSPVSPTGILSHLNEIGASFGQGREEDAHEFLRYAIDTMQSASMKEAKKNGVHKLAEETTLVQLIFGGYLQSKELRLLITWNHYLRFICMSYVPANKKLTISEAPNILTIALKRYQISKDVKFPEHLNLSQFMCETDDYSPVYSLYAVVVHDGVMNAAISGHYVCYVKDPQGRWHEMDDSKVKPVSLKKVLSKCAYMLLYARCAPRVPDSVRKAMLNQGALHAKEPKEMADSGSTPLGGGSYVSMHQGGNLSYTLDNASSYPVPGFGGSDSSSLFTNSEAGSSSTLSSDSTRNSARMEYNYIFGTSDHMRPVSSVVIPEEDELSYMRQRSTFNASSSGHDMDQEGEFVPQSHHRLQVGRGGVLEYPSFRCTDE
ncbi:hypothetical protein BAE44_0016039, partial [Dichanthelium oligosanthes]